MWATTIHGFPHGSHAIPIKVAEARQVLADGATAGATAGAIVDRLMRANTTPHVQVEAAGSVRTLDAPIAVMKLGVARIGVTATEAVTLDFRARRNGHCPVHHAPVDAGGH